ncbi:MAG: nucleotidyl transferase AbiEii/AbiGii toxin family protein [bacterium]
MAEPIQTRQAYAPDVTERSFAVLLELSLVLKAYQQGLVLVGGWVPALLLRRHQAPRVSFQHVGSVDIDFLIDTKALPESQYATIEELLRDRGYVPSARSPFTFERKVQGLPSPIRVDFLVPAPPAGEGRRRETPEVQPARRARTVEDTEVAFRHRIPWGLHGTLPEGGETRGEIRMADLTGILAMKGLVFGQRLKGRGKDAYDIWSLCGYYGAGPGEVGRAMREHLGDPAVRRGLAVIQERFSSPAAVGPAEVERFLMDAVPEGIGNPKVTAFQDVRMMLDAAGI